MIRIALMWRLQAQFAGYVLARKEVPELVLVPGGPGKPPPMSLLEAGDAELATASLASLIGAGPTCAKVALLLVVFPRSPVVLVGLRNHVSHSLQSFRGRIGIWEGEDLEVRAMLKASGVPSSEIEFLPLTEEGVGPLLRGEVGLMQATVYNELRAVEREVGREALVVHRPDQWGLGLPKDGLVIRKDFLQRHSDTVEQVVPAVVRGWRTALARPEEAVGALCELDSSLDPEAQLEQLLSLRTLIDPAIPFARPATSLVRRAIGVRQFVDEAFQPPTVTIHEGPWEQARVG